MLIISDGDVSDKDATMKYATSISTTLLTAKRLAPSAVCLVRAMTSSYANPDTAALACFGKFMKK